MKASQLKSVLDAHAQWLAGSGGQVADLRGADLGRADLRGAYLRGAYLRGAERGRHKVHSAAALGLDFWVVVFDTHIEIGCASHTLAEWQAMSDEQLREIDRRAPEFRRRWGAVIVAAQEALVKERSNG